MSDSNGNAVDAVWRNDGALTNSFAALGNSFSGLGTMRDPSQRVIVQSPKILNWKELDNLFRSSRICEKVVRLLPEAAASGWVDWQLGESDYEASDIDAYLKTIKARRCFLRAGLLGRLYGDGYILLGIDDGAPWEEPVNEENIREIRWCKVLTCEDMIPLIEHHSVLEDYEDPDFYQVYLGTGKDELVQSLGFTTKIHKTRVLRFPGKRLYQQLLQSTAGENDSVLQSMFDAFNKWSSAMGATSAMVQDHSIFTYKLNGLAKLVDRGEQKALTTRFEAIQMGKSVLKGLMMDADNEDASFIQRNYGGVTDIVNGLADWLVADADMPASKLFGSPKGNAFSESGKSDRYEWASCVLGHEESFWRDPLETLQRYVLLAKNGPTKGVLPDGYGFEFKSILQLTREEEAELRYKHSQTDEMRIANQVVHPKEVRDSRYGGAAYSDSITLDPKMEDELYAEPEPAIAPQMALPPDDQTSRPDAPVDPDDGPNDEDLIRGDAADIGQTVQWWDGLRQQSGSVKSVHRNKVTRRGQTLKGTAENPAFVIASDGGDRLLHLSDLKQRRPSLDQLRTDAALGMIPRWVYLEAAGYRVDEVESGLKKELEQDSRADSCLRDERGRFAGGNCGGGGSGGGGGTKAALSSKLSQLKNAVQAKLSDKETRMDLIVNTGGLLGSMVGQHLGGQGGALAGDLIGALAVRQVSNVTEAAMSARAKLRHDADYQMASRVGQLRQLGRATISEFNSPAFQRTMGDRLTGDLTGWAIGNSSAMALNQVPGISAVPFKGAGAAMTTVPRITEARNRINERLTQNE